MTMWALAGTTLRQQKKIADVIGIPMLVDMLMTKSEKLQLVACQAMAAAGWDCKENLEAIVQAGGIVPLLRMLKHTNNSSSNQVR